MPKMLLNQLTLLAVSWCASISWGYQLPVQFAMPGVFAAFCLTEKMDFHFSKKQKRVAGLAVWLLLLATFRYAHDFIYQDGRRSEMTVNLGQVFPQLSGIFSTAETLRTYQELKDLKARFAAPIAVLPIFGQADFLLKQRPVLPTNWAVNRETSHFNDLIYEALESKKPVVLMLKSYGNRIFNDPENSVSVDVLRQKTKIGETEFFWIYQ